MSVPDLQGLLRSLAVAEVDFVLVGGLAVAVHGFIRATEEVDIVPDPLPTISTRWSVTC